MDDVEIERLCKRSLKHPLFRAFAENLVGKEDKIGVKSFMEEFGTIEPLEEQVSFEFFVWERTTANSDPAQKAEPAPKADPPKPYEPTAAPKSILRPRTVSFAEPPQAAQKAPAPAAPASKAPAPASEPLATCPPAQKFLVAPDVSC